MLSDTCGMTGCPALFCQSPGVGPKSPSLWAFGVNTLPVHRGCMSSVNTMTACPVWVSSGNVGAISAYVLCPGVHRPVFLSWRGCVSLSCRVCRFEWVPSLWVGWGSKCSESRAITPLPLSPLRIPWGLFVLYKSYSWIFFLSIFRYLHFW